MFTVISPAKRLNLDPSELPLPATMPALSNDARILQKTAKNLSQKRIAELMKLKPDLAKLTSDRFKAMEFPLPDEDTLQAVLTFNGLAFIGLGARTLCAEDLTWAQDRLGILSGLFGILRPLDRIPPYRLEMGTRMGTRRGKNLYEFWGDKVHKRVHQVLTEQDSETERVLVNLASAEYFRVVQAKKLAARVVTPTFHVDYGTVRKAKGFDAKKARGQMVRYIIENRIDRPEDLHAFDVDGYRFDPDASDESKWIFVQQKPA